MTPCATREISNIPLGILRTEPVVPVMIQPEKEIKPKKQVGGPSKEKVLEALAACQNRREKAAEYLGISRRYLQYKIREYEIPSRNNRKEK